MPNFLQALMFVNLKDLIRDKIAIHHKPGSWNIHPVFQIFNTQEASLIKMSATDTKYSEAL